MTVKGCARKKKIKNTHLFERVARMRYIIPVLVIPRPPARIIPGAVHLPAFFTPAEQEELVNQARELARKAAGTPVAMRRPKVGHGQMDAWLLSLGWFWACLLYTSPSPRDD